MRRQNVPKSDKEKSLKGVEVSEKWIEVETIGLIHKTEIQFFQ